MDAASPSPSGYEITVETKGLDVKKPSPLEDVGKTSELVLHLAVTETHEWNGIGGRRAPLRPTWRLVRDVIIHLPLSRPSYLRSGGDLRRLLVWATVHELILYMYCVGVLRGRVGVDSCKVSFCVHIDFMYDEVAMLLRACFVQPTVDLTAGIERSTGDSGGLSTTSCVICFEEMEATT
ncbi:hypothetical protein HU200_038447 [Digitaria exilis]|uniref:Uncharacterized protein n=1 Tax=Digitaria exilis TaxID=1010633 RepID=A0A835EJB6_9POAL|nr:hypothetical protein HU200_038447 [Digitaria exilis]